jgi:hypothetical protein
MSEMKNIGQRINAVRETCPYIKKDKRVEWYMAVTHDLVTAELRESLITHGVLLNPVLVSQCTIDTGHRTQKGNVTWRFEGVFDVEFLNADNVADKIVSRIAAHANDTGDKAPGKALSYAVKSAMLKVFSIETGEDDESRVSSDAGPLDKETINKHKNLMAACKTLDDLKTALKVAYSAAISDEDAFEEFKEFASALSKRIPKVAMPTEKTPTADAPGAPEKAAATAAPEPAPVQNPDAEGPDTTAAATRGAPASAGMVKTLVASLAGDEKMKAAILKKFKVKSLDALDKEECKAALARVLELKAPKE